MLYDGALRFLREARDAIERSDIAARARGVSRALAIVAELQSTLNLEEGGEIAARSTRCTATPTPSCSTRLRRTPWRRSTTRPGVRDPARGWATVAASQ